MDRPLCIRVDGPVILYFSQQHTVVRLLQQTLPGETFRIRAFTEFTVKTYKPLKRR